MQNIKPVTLFDQARRDYIADYLAAKGQDFRSGGEIVAEDLILWVAFVTTRFMQRPIQGEQDVKEWFETLHWICLADPAHDFSTLTWRQLAALYHEQNRKLTIPPTPLFNGRVFEGTMDATVTRIMDNMRKHCAKFRTGTPRLHEICHEVNENTVHPDLRAEAAPAVSVKELVDFVTFVGGVDMQTNVREKAFIVVDRAKRILNCMGEIKAPAKPKPEPVLHADFPWEMHGDDIVGLGGITVAEVTWTDATSDEDKANRAILAKIIAEGTAAPKPPLSREKLLEGLLVWAVTQAHDGVTRKAAETLLSGFSNGHRAGRAGEALGTYKRMQLAEGGMVGLCDITDLLTDILHLCDREGWNFAESLESARKNHSRER